MSDAEAYQNLCDRIDRFIDKALEYGRCELCSRQTELIYFAIHTAFPNEPDAICTLRERMSQRGIISAQSQQGNDIYYGVRLRSEYIPPNADAHLHACFP